MRSIIQHLRFPFSYLLLPVFLMALLTIDSNSENYKFLWLLFLILHLLVYPSSNAYNSLQDQDEESIGLIKKPLPASEHLGQISLVMDALAVILSLIISIPTAVEILVYILISRLYSYRNVRLKQYPILGFLVVFIFQGAWIYMLVNQALDNFSLNPYMNAQPFFTAASSCLIGSIYPLSQIYQHESDKADGVTTISYLFGKKGTFVFSGILFLVGSTLLLYPALDTGDFKFTLLYLAFQLPSLIYFNYWFYKVIKDESQANFKHTMRMSLISATCMNAFFLFLLFW